MPDLRLISNNVCVCSGESIRHTQYPHSYKRSQCLKATTFDSYKAIPSYIGVSLDCLERQIIVSFQA